MSKAALVPLGDITDNSGKNTGYSVNLDGEIVDVSDCPFPFFEETKEPTKKMYKIYNDGGHYVATEYYRRTPRPQYSGIRKNEDLDIAFDSLYFHALRLGLKDAELTDSIKTCLEKLFSDVADLDKYIEKRIERKKRSLYSRKKRFRRKAALNRWNYFVTFTYDDKKHTPESFRTKLRKCLSNLHTRRGWNYMGVFEYAPETGRLHFHGLLYVPSGQMIGKITEIKDYSTAQGKMQITHINSFFAEGFGRNDFEELNAMELKKGNTLNYLLKYIGKTGERIVYSRGIPTEICKTLSEREIVGEMKDFVAKFVLFDDTIDWERDIMHYTHYKQITVIDILCNPPQVA